jgi:hypothetical protein
VLTAGSSSFHGTDHIQVTLPLLRTDHGAGSPAGAADHQAAERVATGQAAGEAHPDAPEGRDALPKRWCPLESGRQNQSRRLSDPAVADGVQVGPDHPSIQGPNSRWPVPANNPIRSCADRVDSRPRLNGGRLNLIDRRRYLFPPITQERAPAVGGRGHGSSMSLPD